MNEQELEDFIDTYVIQQLPKNILSLKHDGYILQEERKKEGKDSNECELESTV